VPLAGDCEQRVRLLDDERQRRATDEMTGLIVRLWRAATDGDYFAL
jgi:hypothetical protein